MAERILLDTLRNLLSCSSPIPRAGVAALVDVICTHPDYHQLRATLLERTDLTIDQALRVASETQVHNGIVTSLLSRSDLDADAVWTWLEPHLIDTSLVGAAARSTRHPQVLRQLLAYTNTGDVHVYPFFLDNPHVSTDVGVEALTRYVAATRHRDGAGWRYTLKGLQLRADIVNAWAAMCTDVIELRMLGVARTTDTAVLLHAGRVALSSETALEGEARQLLRFVLTHPCTTVEVRDQLVAYARELQCTDRGRALTHERSLYAVLDDYPNRIQESTVPGVLTQAANSATAAQLLLRALSDGLPDSTPTWKVALSLLPTFPGTVDELVGAAAGVTGTNPRDHSNATSTD